MINNFHISDKKCIFGVHSRPTLENNILSSHFIEAPVGRCGFDLRAFFIIMDTTKEKEIWKNIPGYEGYYQASDLGRVRSLDRTVIYKDGRKRFYKGKLIKGRISKGYKYTNVSINNVGRNLLFSQLVAMAFLGHEPNGHTLVIDHIDGDKSDNRLENLRIVTQRENVSTCFRSNKESFTSNYAGVSWDVNTSKWKANIHNEGVNVRLGSFDDEINASSAYEDALDDIAYGVFNPETYKRKCKGIDFNKTSGKWRARIRINKKRKHIGYFKTEKEAYEAQQKALKEYNL